jgi:hypothetical protein
MIGTDTVAAMLISPATIEPMKRHFWTNTTGRRRRSQPSERSASTDARGRSKRSGAAAVGDVAGIVRPYG